MRLGLRTASISFKATIIMANPDSTLSLVVDGKRFDGWTDVRMSVASNACGEFNITCTQRWPGQDARFEIFRSSRLRDLDRQRFSPANVDAIGVERSSDNASCKIMDRSKTADLVDCSPNYELTELAGLTLFGCRREARQSSA